MGNTQTGAAPLGYRPPPAQPTPQQGPCLNGWVVGIALLFLAVCAALIVLVGKQNLSTDYTSCSIEPLPGLWEYTPSGQELQVKILIYNLFWWQLFDAQKTANGSPFRLMENFDKPMPFDFMGFQECEDGALVLRGANMLDQYTWYPGMGTTTTAICMAFLTRNWEHLSHGCQFISEDAPAEHW